jgi:DNA-directed RNA polymerase subunit beta
MSIQLSKKGYAYTRRRLQLGQKAKMLPPGLTDIQKLSYERFEKEGMESALKDTWPITNQKPGGQKSGVSNSGHLKLDLVSWVLEDPEYDQRDCVTRGASYSSALKAKLRLTIYDKDTGIEGGQIQQIKEKELYLCEIPLMTETGSFIYNGTVRVVVSQMHRSPGVIFEHDKGRTLASGKIMHKSRVIPYRGAWLDVEFYKECIYMRIDRRKKMPVTILFRALGMDTAEILKTFYEFDTVKLSRDKKNKHALITFSVDPERLRGDAAFCDIQDKKGEFIVKKGQRISQRHVRRMIKENIKTLNLNPEDLIGKVLAEDVVDKRTGVLIATANSLIDPEIIDELLTTESVTEFNMLWINELQKGPYISDTLRIDLSKTTQEAHFEIYRVMRPGEPPTESSAKALFHDLFFNEDRYDLSEVGRMKINHRLLLDKPLDHGVLSPEDIIAVVSKLVAIRDGYDEVDDIDNLGNRRVRSVGELLENQLRVGLSRMERSAKDRLSLNMDEEDLSPQNLINCNPIISSINDFFALNPLSQYADMVNPLAEITHKRRISALGQGGLTRERAGFEVRDVHHTHYGRLCPVETPEGQNIGLINSAAVYVRANRFGFLETPFYRVENSKVTDKVVYLSAIEEGHHVIVQATTPTDKKGIIQGSLIPCRYQREFVVTTPDKIDFIDVAPNQIVSAAASLIPFMEHDDGPRVLMGSNMQRQAVPLVKAEAPLVGTGIERIVASDSGATINALRDGEVVFVDAARIVVKVKRSSKAGGAEVSGVDVYALNKFSRSNQNTCVDQKPIVSMNQKVRKGEVLADGVSVDQGELALGQNVLIAFMPWRGYNHEDSIVISERLVRKDAFCSIHIQELVCTVRETTLGDEKLTADIPNISEQSLVKLDETGIVYIGAEVVPGDILVGKIAPKGETQLTPEEKLLRAIFGEKASDVKDISLRVPSGSSGVVIGVKIFTRETAEKDERTLAIEDSLVNEMVKNEQVECDLKTNDIVDQMKELIAKQKIEKLKNFKKGAILTQKDLASLSLSDLCSVVLQDENKNKDLESLVDSLKSLKTYYKDRIEKHGIKVRSGDNLPPGVIKNIKIYLAVKRRIQPGDKMAGRHGNKGCISTVIPEEDMPYLEDGTPVDMVLNPLGVPSRMNVGQVLEVHLGAAAMQLGHCLKKMIDEHKPVSEIRGFVSQIGEVGQAHDFDVQAMPDEEVLAIAHNWSSGVPMASPVFAGATEEQIKGLLKLSGLSESGQTVLYNGRTGEAFDRPVTVGYMYMLKLNHLVDDKMHARSTGSYSLVTQQPLGGKAQFGGQRFGEMEVWALQAYGAAYTLQEMLTVKSDDVRGRSNMYKSIISRECKLEPNVPDSFKVLMREIQALGINIRLEKD